MEQEHIEEALEISRDIDKKAIERSNRAARQLADAGIELGGYRLEPALGGTLLDRPLLTAAHFGKKPGQQ